jgi:hypothetical protein
LLFVEFVGEDFAATEVDDVEFPLLDLQGEDNVGAGGFAVDVGLSEYFVGMCYLEQFY